MKYGALVFDKTGPNSSVALIYVCIYQLSGPWLIWSTWYTRKKKNCKKQQQGASINVMNHENCYEKLIVGKQGCKASLFWLFPSHCHHSKTKREEWRLFTSAILLKTSPKPEYQPLSRWKGVVFRCDWWDMMRQPPKILHKAIAEKFANNLHASSQWWPFMGKPQDLC